MALFIRLSLIILTVFGCAQLRAELPVAPPLPEPLTLEKALEFADAPHPQVLEAQAEVDRSRAERDGIDAYDNWNAYLEGRLQWVDPSPRVEDQGHNDSQIGLVLSKRLYDFGRTQSALAAADSALHSSELMYTDAQAQRRITIMHAFFAVILADLAYARDNEAMATAYVSFDRQRDRKSLGKISDIQVSESEVEYQKARSKRYASDVSRRSTRARLASLLNHPGALPANLVQPDLPDLDRKLPEVERLQELALAHNPELEALRAQVEAARDRLKAARADKYPIITGELEAADYARELGSSDRLRAGIKFKMPLYTGGAVRAEIARQIAEMKRAAARRAQREMDVRQAVLDVWQEIYVLRARRDEARAETDYRDLYLDRSRALYELDVRTDLGDSMAQFSAARYQTAQVDFKLALALARLQALLGEPIPEPRNGAESGSGAVHTPAQ